MEVLGTPPDALELLVGQRLLAGVSNEVLESLTARLEWRRYLGAEYVIRSGDPADGLGFVIDGRLRVMVGGTVVGEIGQGEPFGETGPLTGRPRNADLLTIRDTVVGWLGLVEFEAVVREHPEVALLLARHALSRDTSVFRGRGIATTVALASASPGIDVVQVAEELAGLGMDRPISVIPPDTDRADTLRLIAAFEHEGHQVLLPTRPGSDADDAAWRVRQADRVWVIVDGGDEASYRPGSLGAMTELIRQTSSDGITPAVEVVVIHPATVGLPRSTRHLLAQLDVVGHHHVRSGDRQHLERLVRHLQGRSVNLVLSGGGARGHAHLGVHQVLTGAGCPIDTVAGTSFGALIAAQIADNEPTKVLIERNRSWIDAKIGTSFSYPPVLSLMSIKRALRVFDELFGDRDLEDLWLPCLVAAVDLSDGALRIIERGPIAAMVRASGSPPGLWPPVPDDRGHLLVDGALVDNLPVDARRTRTAGPVIAVDVSKTAEMTVSPEVGSVTGLLDFVRSLRSKSPYPTMPKVLMRSMTLSGAARLREALDVSDLVVQPDVSTITLPEHKRAPEAIAAGVAAAEIALAAHPGLVESWR